MYRSVLASLSLAAMLVAAAPASAAIISQFTYDIVGGGAFINNTPFPPVSGSLTVTPLTPVSTGAGSYLGPAQVSFNFATTGGATVVFGPLGGLTIFGAGPSIMVLDIVATTPNQAPFSINGSPFTATVGNALSALVVNNMNNPNGGFSASFVASVFTSQFVNLILGNEVRTVVPEPMSAAMLGLGLLGLAAGGGGAARARRRGRA